MKKLALLSIPFVIGGLVACHPSYLLNGQNASVENKVIEDEYDFGTTFTAPTVEEGGVILSSVIVFPDQTATSEKTVLLNQSGTYSVHYSGFVDGKAVGQDYTFIVKNQYFTFSDDESFAKYENSERTKGYEGLYVNLLPGQTLTFNQTIDMTNAYKNIDLFTFYAAPEDVGKMDFSELDITFTDIEDPTVYLKIRVKATQDGMAYPYSYVDAGANGQDMVGVEGGKTIHVNSQFGCAITHSFYGYYTSPTMGVGKQRVKLNYDVDENALYVNNGSGFVTDFDSSKYYSTIWDGFKSGKAKVSMTPVGAVSSGAKFVITNIKDIDLTQTVIEDETDPEITVDTSYDLEHLPNAVVGGKYPVFAATAVDNLTKDIDVSASVYYLKNNVRYDVSTENGYFDVKREGTYLISYVARDGVGNVGEKVLTVETTNNYKQMTITPRSVIVDEVKRGEKYELPSFKISNGSGNYDTSYEVTFNGQPIAINKQSFTPTELGVYKVKFTARDITLAEKTYEYSVNCLYNEQPAFDGEPELQKYFISGFENKLPELYATDYTQNGIKILADVVISDGTSSVTIKSGETYKPAITNHLDYLTVTYKAGTKEKSYQIPCVKAFDDRYIKIDRYFIMDNATIDTSLEDRSRITATEDGTASWEFANPLIAQNCQVKLSFDANGTTYNFLNVTFTDKIDSSKKLTVKMENGVSNNTLVRVGKQTIKTDIPFGEEEEFSISFKNNCIYVNKSYVEVNCYDDGREFEGFDSNYVYLSSSMEGAQAGSSYYLFQIDNQAIVETRADRMEPIITTIDKYGGFAELNDSVTTARIIASDVLDPNASSSMSVRSPSNEYVVDSNGVVLNAADATVKHTIVTSEYGQYALNYFATDSRGNEATFVYSIGVLDNEKPVITLTSGYTTSCSLGDKMIVPTYTVSDNLGTEDIHSYVTITSPLGTSYALPSSSNSFKPTQAGTYTVTIHAYDLAGNMATITYNVVVK